MNSNKIPKAKIKLLVYGSDKKGLLTPNEPLRVGDIEIFFEPFDTDSKFQEYDGVIIFQGIWAKRVTKSDWTGDSNSRLENVEKSMMMTRIKQLELLQSNGGFVCFLMGRLEYDDFDLSKTVLGWFQNTYPKATADNPYVRNIYFNELRNYMKSDYGIAKTTYSHYGDEDYKVLADCTSYDGDIAICFNRNTYFLPCQIIKKDEFHTVELFELLIPALIGTHKKLNQEIPKWLQKHNFSNEVKLMKKKVEIECALEKTESDLKLLEELKKPLVLSGSTLVESVANLFNNGIGLKVTNEDKGFDDLQLISKLSKKDNVVAVIEVKGINGNVTRENIAQVDAHKERNGFSDKFPGILIANTFIKNSNSIDDKNKPIEKEQILHSVKMNVLILRTLDLVNMYDLISSGKVNTDEFFEILISKNGWLEVTDKGMLLHTE